ncbi:hypothetical protein V8G54_020313 [Vigna mungo]|uniref:USP domain-containing protein n=1 Tax=Vigna mungo TaxID=3915 RepID=A0AAQ3NDI6_VIGMU
MYLSLPLQSSTASRTMTVTVFACDGAALPSPCTVTVPKQGRIKDLIQALSNACSLKHNERLLLVEVRNHLIHRYLEDPVHLSTIKDDERLAAYKIPKIDKNTKYLQLIHRRREHFGIWENSVMFNNHNKSRGHDIVSSSDSHVISGWKPYGTPIVSLISCDDTVTRGDIQVMVNRILSPLLRRGGNVEQATNSEASIPKAEPDECSNTHDAASVGNVVSNSSNKDFTNSKAPSMPTLPLLLVGDNNACIDLSMGEEKVVKLPQSSPKVLVYIDWSQKLLEKYDTHPIESLPEVLKYGPVTKKARTEPLSLYTCLEAFLREEPLVPEDMWSMKHKLETFVNFPIHDFDLTNYIANKNNSRRQLYELYALTNHYGSMGSGHYTAHIKLLDENRWYNFDDSHITLISEDEVNTAAAYVLFYRRVKTEEAAISNGA